MRVGLKKHKAKKKNRRLGSSLVYSSKSLCDFEPMSFSPPRVPISITRWPLGSGYEWPQMALFSER